MLRCASQSAGASRDFYRGGTIARSTELIIVADWNKSKCFFQINKKYFSIRFASLRSKAQQTSFPAITLAQPPYALTR